MSEFVASAIFSAKTFVVPVAEKYITRLSELSDIGGVEGRGVSVGRVIFVIVVFCSDWSQLTLNLKLSAIKRMGSIVRSFIIAGAVSRICAVPFKYAVLSSITSFISYSL